MSSTALPKARRPFVFQWRYLLSLPLVFMAIFYLIPLYLMLITGFKGFDFKPDLKDIHNPAEFLRLQQKTEILDGILPSFFFINS